jgi:hypothetical protein
MKVSYRVWLLAAAAALLLTTSASADEMPGMEMPAEHDMTEMTPGEMDAMTHVNPHDTHLGPEAMKNMALHMTFTDLMPANPADQARAAELVETLKRALAKYQDYHVAEADGFKPFHPEIKRIKVVHFTKWWYGLKAAFTFNPAEPTSLLYERASDGGYKLVGAMYTAPKRWNADELNQRVPLSVARWHKHINICFPPRGTDPKAADWSRFGPNGSIATKAACDAVDGRFYPTLFGWMVHVYPWETDPRQVWAH